MQTEMERESQGLHADDREQKNFTAFNTGHKTALKSMGQHSAYLSAHASTATPSVLDRSQDLVYLKSDEETDFQ